jgi:hypothetical protein
MRTALLLAREPRDIDQVISTKSSPAKIVASQADFEAHGATPSVQTCSPDRSSAPTVA